jgi:hypothetical protein
MLGAIVRAFRRGDKNAPLTDEMPLDLALAVGRARVRHSARPDADGFPIVRVRVPLIGDWRWTGIGDAETRLRAFFPKAGNGALRRAARLLEAEVGEAAVQANRLPAEERRSWIWDW